VPGQYYKKIRTVNTCINPNLLVGRIKMGPEDGKADHFIKEKDAKNEKTRDLNPQKIQAQ